MPGDQTNRLIKFSDFELDLDAAVLRSGGATVIVEPQVFELIAFLVTNQGRLVSYDEIIANVWRGRIVSDAAIATRVNAARKALGDDGSAQRVIKTLRGRGLRFDLKPLAMVSEIDAGSRQQPALLAIAARLQAICRQLRCCHSRTCRATPIKGTSPTALSRTSSRAFRVSGSFLSSRAIRRSSTRGGPSTSARSDASLAYAIYWKAAFARQEICLGNL